MLAPGKMKAFRLRVLNLNMYMYSIILVIHPGILGDGRYIHNSKSSNLSFPFGSEPLFSNVLVLRIPAYLFNIQDAANCCLLWLLVIMAMQARIVGDGERHVTFETCPGPFLKRVPCSNLWLEHAPER